MATGQLWLCEHTLQLLELTPKAIAPPHHQNAGPVRICVPSCRVMWLRSLNKCFKVLQTIAKCGLSTCVTHLIPFQHMSQHLASHYPTGRAPVVRDL